MKRPALQSIAFLIAEAVLIIVSIYIAFLLEDKRSRDFERKIFIGKLHALDKELVSDSLKYDSMINRENDMGTLYLPDFKRNDSLVLMYLESRVKGRYDSIITLDTTKRLFLWWGKQWTEESPTYQSILESYNHFILQDTMEMELESYFRTKRFINELNLRYIEEKREMDSYLSEKFPYSSTGRYREEKIRVPLWQNTLALSYELVGYYIQIIPKLLESNTGLREIIAKEIEMQEKML